MEGARWFDRKFDGALDANAFPAIVERLRGTPARVDEKLAQTPSALLTERLNDTWSIQENVGHLLDLEPLWHGRLDDLLEGREELRPADLTNRKTDEARHNERPVAEIAARFRNERLRLVERLDRLGPADVLRAALHPRLRAPMRVIDLCFFVAEHDDHHLARVSAVTTRLAAR